MRILIAEDDADSRHGMRAYLEGEGHTVASAAGGLEAWAAFDAEPFPVVVSDWLLPGIDGLELCKRIRERPRTDYTYFILVTKAHEERTTLMKVLTAGADDFLPKPADLELLGARLAVAQRVLSLETKVRHLQGFLPICAYCKRIRVDESKFERLENFIERNSGATFSHTYCPDCLAKHFKKS